MTDVEGFVVRPYLMCMRSQSIVSENNTDYSPKEVWIFDEIRKRKERIK